MQIVPRRFCHISTKISVLWPSKSEPALGIMRAMRPHRAAKFRGPPNSTAPVTGAHAGAKVLSSQTQSDTNSSDVDGLGLFDEL